MVHTINSLYPAIQVSHIRICSASPFPCATADLPSRRALVSSLFITASYSSLRPRLPLPISLFGGIGRPMLSSEYNSPRTRHDLYTPTLFFSLNAPHFFPTLRRTMYDSFMFSTLLFISSFMTSPCIASRWLLAAATLHLDRVVHRLPVVLERFYFRTLSYCYPAVPSFLLCLAYSSRFYLLFPPPPFFFTFSLCHLPPSPLQPSFITIHEPVTKTKQPMRRLLFLPSLNDPCLILVYLYKPIDENTGEHVTSNSVRGVGHER